MEWDCYRNSGLKLTGSNYNFIAKYLDHSTELNDVQAPSQVTGINAKNVTSSSLMLSWEAATDNRGISKYELYVDGKKTATTALTKIEFNRLVANKTYSFAIVAVDDAGNQSQISESYSVTTLPENVEETGEAKFMGIYSSLYFWRCSKLSRTRISCKMVDKK
ncbi:fibronectin type III domain-containing protein [Enterococcus rivorum]|uniref:fibronectin type III domain-containing protein n=1 Tax=Enterococcus rivorum TaxID=762845 RepID=UPI00362E7967